MLIVGKSGVNYGATGGVANAAITPDRLDAGSVGIYGRDKDGLKDVLIIQGASATGKVQASLFKGKTIRICEGLGGGKFKVSEYIDVLGISLYHSGASAYAAPVAWKGFIGYNDVTLTGNVNVAASTDVRNAIDVRIAENDPNAPSDRHYPIYYTVIVPAGTAGAAYDEAVVDTIVAEVNKDNKFVATKVESGTMFGVKLVANDITKDYKLSVLSDIVEFADISYVGGSSGVGTRAKVLELEKKSSPYRGDLYTMSAIDKHVVSSVADNTYDVYTIGTTNSQIPGGMGGAGLAGNANVESTVGVVAVFGQPGTEAAGANQNEFAEIFNDLVPGIFGDVVEPVI